MVRLVLTRVDCGFLDLGRELRKMAAEFDLLIDDREEKLVPRVSDRHDHEVCG